MSKPPSSSSSKTWMRCMACAVPLSGRWSAERHCSKLTTMTAMRQPPRLLLLLLHLLAGAGRADGGLPALLSLPSLTKDWSPPRLNVPTHRRNGGMERGGGESFQSPPHHQLQPSPPLPPPPLPAGRNRRRLVVIASRSATRQALLTARAAGLPGDACTGHPPRGPRRRHGQSATSRGPAAVAPVRAGPAAGEPSKRGIHAEARLREGLAPGRRHRRPQPNPSLPQGARPCSLLGFVLAATHLR